MPKAWDCPGRVAGWDIGAAVAVLLSRVGGHEAARLSPHPQAQSHSWRQAGRVPG